MHRSVRLLERSGATQQRIDVLRRIDDHEELIPGIIEVRNSGSFLVLVQKWLKGRSLRDYIRAGMRGSQPGISAHQCVMMFRVFALHLSALHRGGFVVHGDIKPDNILIVKKRVWRMMLVDFGSSWTSETSQDRRMGDGITPVYSAPECQCELGPGNYLSDQFSASVTFYEMLTGEIPYDRFGGAVGDRDIGLQPPSEIRLDQTNYPGSFLDHLDSVLKQGLNLKPDDRFPKDREWEREMAKMVRLLAPAGKSNAKWDWIRRNFLGG